MTQPVEPPRPPEGMKFNQPPGWPPPPDGWTRPADFQPDPSWPPAPPDWQWWAPIDQPDPQGSWVARHQLLTAALVVVVLLVLAGGATGGILLAANLSDEPTSSAAESPAHGRSPVPSPTPSAAGSGNANSPENIAACGGAAAPHRKAVALLSGLRTNNVTNAAAIAAIPPIQADLSAAGSSPTGVLATDLREYAAALGALRTTLIQGKDPNQAEGYVLVYAIVFKAACDL